MKAFLGQVPIRGATLGQANPPPWSVEREIKKKQQECYFLRITYNSTVAEYYQEGTAPEYYDEILEPARLALNVCSEELQELYDTADYGPLKPAQAVRIPLNWPGQESTPLEPSDLEPEPEMPGPAASVPLPAEIPAPSIAPITGDEESPTVEPTDCDPLKGTFFDPRTGKCRGSVSSIPAGGFGMGPSTFAPSATMAPQMMTSAAYLGRIRLSRFTGRF